jgi:hypothetical protein
MPVPSRVMPVPQPALKALCVPACARDRPVAPTKQMVGRFSMRFAVLTSIALVAVLFVLRAVGFADEMPQLHKLSPPPPGQFYQGVFPGGVPKQDCGTETGIKPKEVATYEKRTGKPVAWISFSHEWSRGTKFPADTAKWISDRGAVPYIRLELRSETKKRQDYKKPEQYTLDAVLAKTFDAQLREWAQDAKAFGRPLLVVYGAECNGFWSTTNGYWNGAGETNGFGDPDKADGPERFRAAYGHIVTVMKEAGANNITWVFHVNYDDNARIGGNKQNPAWNVVANYYPGGDVVDWVGVSAYGTLDPNTEAPLPFKERMQKVYDSLTAAAPGKPVIVAEFGYGVRCSSLQGPAAGSWVRAALQDIFKGVWPAVIGFAWWNEAWCTNDHGYVTLRLQEIPDLAYAFKNALSENEKLLSTPVVDERQ